jgi:ATP-dependent Clp protease ATP-binding subunit ClpC
MFDRYTEKARRVIFLARHEASLARASHIEPEHVLLGLIREAPTLHGVIPPTSIEAIRLRLQPPDQEASDTTIDMPLSGSTKKILITAADEAGMLQSPVIDAPHLLAALLKVSSPAADLLRSGLV